MFLNHIIPIVISIVASSFVSILLVYFGLSAGLFPAPQHEQLLHALAQVTIADGVSIDRQLLDSEELRDISEEYRELSDRYRLIQAEIDRLVAAQEPVPGELYDQENQLGLELQELGRAIILQTE